MNSQTLVNTDLLLRCRQLEEEVAEKNTMIREMNHRLKNNLSIINSLIHIKKLDEEDSTEFIISLPDRR